MGEKDIAEKILEDYPDVFADIVNGFLFDGEEVIKPEETRTALLKALKGLKNKEVDVPYKKHGNIPL